MKKFFALLLSLLLVVSLFSISFADEPQSGGGEWETDPIFFGEDISSATVKGIVAKYYTGKPITQKLSVVYKGETLKEKTDYTLDYFNNNKVGTASVVVTGIGAYKGTIKRNFLINLAKPKVKVTNGTTCVKLSWAKVAGAKQYAVYQYNTLKKSYIKLATVSSLSYLIKGKAAGTGYYFLVRATDGTHASPYSTADNVKAVTLCKAPAVKAAVSAKTVTLKWAKCTGAKFYRVYKYNTATKKYTTLVSKTSALSLKLSAQRKGTNYYLVRAFNANNAGNTFTTKNLVKAVVK